MKKYFIFLSALVIATTSCKKNDDEIIEEDPAPAEFTISSSDFGNVGDTFYMAKDISNLDSVITSPVDGIWDFSSLSEDEADTSIYFDPSIFAAYSDFPDANIAFSMSEGIAFAIKSDSQIEMIGFTMSQNGTDINVPLDDHLIMNKFPFKKGDTYTDTGHGTATTSMDYNGFPVTVNIEINLTVNSTIEFEAEMKLPGSSSKCLSEYQVTISNIIATALGNEVLNQTDTTKAYNYYASGKGTTYATVNIDSLGNTSNVVYLKEL